MTGGMCQGHPDLPCKKARTMGEKGGKKNLMFFFF
jgi:hypothetical protein